MHESIATTSASNLGWFLPNTERPMERSSYNVFEGQEKPSSVFEVIHRRTTMKIKGRNEMASTVTPGHQERLNQAVI